MKDELFTSLDLAIIKEAMKQHKLTALKVMSRSDEPFRALLAASDKIDRLYTRAAKHERSSHDPQS